MLMLVVSINNRSEYVNVYSLCFNSRCVSLGAGSVNLWTHLHKTNKAADETCVPYILIYAIFNNCVDLTFE